MAGIIAGEEPVPYLYLARGPRMNQPYHLFADCRQFKAAPRRVWVGSDFPRLTICQRCADRRVRLLGRQSLATLWRLYTDLEGRVRALEAGATEGRRRAG